MITIYFTTSAGNTEHTMHVDCKNLVIARVLWDTLSHVFHMISSRP